MLLCTVSAKSVASWTASGFFLCIMAQSINLDYISSPLGDLDLLLLLAISHELAGNVPK